MFFFSFFIYFCVSLVYVSCTRFDALPIEIIFLLKKKEYRPDYYYLFIPENQYRPEICVAELMVTVQKYSLTYKSLVICHI